MEKSNEYQNRRGIASFFNSTFSITNGKNDTTIECTLIKIPTHEVKRTYKQKICEGNGWYTMGETVTKTYVRDSYWLIVHNNYCIGMLDHTIKESCSKKHKILPISNTLFVKEFIKTL